jgi:hypothetical protein
VIAHHRHRVYTIFVPITAIRIANQRRSSRTSSTTFSSCGA